MTVIVQFSPMEFWHRRLIRQMEVGMALRTKKMPRTVYLEERQHLAKYEQTNYENYEKTILTLSSAFLAFSISFLSLFDKSSDINNSVFPIVVTTAFLFSSWIMFAFSVLSILDSLPLESRQHKE